MIEHKAQYQHRAACLRGEGKGRGRKLDVFRDQDIIIPNLESLI